MAADYVPILILFAIAALICAVMVTASKLLGPRRPTPYKDSPYECGVEPIGSPKERFPVKFFLVAILFIIFDIESIFLYPWYTVFKDGTPEFQKFTLIEMGTFFVLLIVGYLYVIRRNAIDFDEGAEGLREQESVPATPAIPAQEEVA